MAFSKAHRFNKRDFHFSLICQVLSHPARIAIVRQLYRKSECTVNELRNGLPLGGPAVSQHLRILRERQIVCCRSSAPTVYYRLNEDIPRSYRVLIELITKVNAYFPRVVPEEIAYLYRSKGPARPAS
jgi:DNA-binding transcriptional ArsR family regulator